MQPSIKSAVLLCLLGILVVIGGLGHQVRRLVTDKGRDATGVIDFLAFYSGAHLVGTGHLYDIKSIQKIQVDTVGKYSVGELFVRMPAFALFFWPIARLPYDVAKYAWIAVQLICVIAAVCIWPQPRRVAAIVVCWSLPILFSMAVGTDAALLLFWLSLWHRLEAENRPLLSGIALSMCLAKFHLFLFLPLLLLRHRRFSVIRGAVMGFAGLVLLSYLAEGSHWPADYFHAMMTPGINHNVWLMPNIHGLAPAGIEIPLLIVTVISISVIIVRFDYEAGLVAALIGSLLCSYHCYVADGVILIPAVVVLLEQKRSVLLRGVGVMLASPIPWLVGLHRGGR